MAAIPSGLLKALQNPAATGLLRHFQVHGQAIKATARNQPKTLDSDPENVARIAFLPALPGVVLLNASRYSFAIAQTSEPPMSQPHNIHPGEILHAEFLLPMGLSQNRLARAIGVPPRRINEIVLGKRGISADTALRLAAAFGTSAEFWMGLQEGYELREARAVLGESLAAIERLAA
jgi:addiction module HigA family antidote